MILNEDRMNHSYHVAEYMYTHAAEYGLEAEKEQMYVVGLLHDVGSIRDKTRHEIAGGEILSQTGLKEEYLNAIAWHGKSPEDYCEHFGITQEDIPPVLVLLWDADLHVGPKGESMEIDERIEDMISRHRRIAQYGFGYEFDPHVAVKLDSTNAVTQIDVREHLTYGQVARKVQAFLIEYKRRHSLV